MYFLPSIWGIVTGIGLWRLKNWARISIIVFSILLILMSGFAALASLIIPIPVSPTKGIEPTTVIAVKVLMGLFWSTLLALGIWWLVFFNRSKVKAQFVQFAIAPPNESTLQTAYSAQSVPVGAAGPPKAKRPLSITIIAWLLLVGCFFIPFTLLMHTPVILFTKVLTGRSATLFFLVFAVAQLFIGIGLLRLRSEARMAAILLFGFGLLNSAVFYLTPGAHDRVRALMDSQRTMFPWMPQAQSQAMPFIDAAPFVVLGAAVGLVVVMVKLYFLLTRKLAFRDAKV
jgi:hypothetical protein